MDRKDFLITIWTKGIRPILLVAIIFFCIKFIYNIFSESGTERFMTILILGFGLLMLTAYLIGQLFKSLITRIYSTFADSVKSWVRIIGKFLNYISPIILGMIIYHLWKEDWKTAAIILGILLFQRLTEIIKEEKQAIKIAEKS